MRCTGLFSFLAGIDCCDFACDSDSAVSDSRCEYLCGRGLAKKEKPKKSISEIAHKLEWKVTWFICLVYMLGLYAR